MPDDIHYDIEAAARNADKPRIIVRQEKWDCVRAEVQRLQDMVKLLVKIHPPKYQHPCLEWDGLVINEYCPEFECCTCFKEINEIKLKEMRKNHESPDCDPR